MSALSGAAAAGDSRHFAINVAAHAASGYAGPVLEWGVLPKTRAYAPLHDPANICQHAFLQVHDAVRALNYTEVLKGNKSKADHVPNPRTVLDRVSAEEDKDEDEEEDEEDEEDEEGPKKGKKKGKRGRPPKERKLPATERPESVNQRARASRSVWDPYAELGTTPDPLKGLKGSLSSIQLDILRAAAQRPMALRRKEFRDHLFRRVLAPNQLPHAIMHTVNDPSSVITCSDASVHATQFAAGTMDGRVLVWRLDRQPHGTPAGVSEEDAVEDALLPPAPFGGIPGTKCIPRSPHVLLSTLPRFSASMLDTSTTGQIVAKLALESGEGAEPSPKPISSKVTPEVGDLARFVPGFAHREILRKLQSGEHRHRASVPASGAAAAGAADAAAPVGTTTAAVSPSATSARARVPSARDPPTDPSVALEMVGHGARVTCVAISPDDTACASCAADGSILLWDLEHGLIANEFTGHQGAAWCVSWSPVGRFLVSGGSDGTARVWDPASTTPFIVFPMKCGSITAVAFHPNASAVALGTDAGDVLLVRTPTAQEAPETVLSAALHASGAPFEPEVLMSATNEHSDTITSIAWRGDGLLMATGDMSGRIVLWNMDARTPLAVRETTFSLHAEAVWSLSFSACGTQLAAASMDGTASLWHIHPFVMRHRLRVATPTSGLGSDGQLPAESLRASEAGVASALGTLQHMEERGDGDATRFAAALAGGFDPYAEGEGPLSALAEGVQESAFRGKDVVKDPLEAARGAAAAAAAGYAERVAVQGQDAEKWERERDRLLRLEYLMRVESEEAPGTCARAFALESTYELGAVHVLAGTAEPPVAPRRPTIMLELEAVAVALGVCPDAYRSQEGVQVVRGEPKIYFPHVKPEGLHYLARAVGGDSSVRHHLKLQNVLDGSSPDTIFQGPPPPFDERVRRACVTMREPRLLSQLVDRCSVGRHRGDTMGVQSVLGIVGRPFVAASANMTADQYEAVAAATDTGSSVPGTRLPPPTRAAFIDECVHEDGGVPDERAEAPFLLRRLRTRETPLFVAKFTRRNLLVTVGVLGGSQ